jgi:glycosyltransferase involved in cell wall biosynthesis
VRILIAEPHTSGHHASYLRWLAQAVRSAGCQVTIATSAAAVEDPALVDLSNCHGIGIREIPGFDQHEPHGFGPLSIIAREFAYWKSFRRAVAELRETPPDAVILPYIDYCFHAVAAFGSPFQNLPWCAISMRLGVDPEAASEADRCPMKWRLARRVLAGSTLRALFSINPSVNELPRNWCPENLRRKMQYLPDPAEFRPRGRRESRTTLGIADADMVILVFGVLDERKGAEFLLDCLASEQGLDSCVVVLAGRQTDRLRSRLRTDTYASLTSRHRVIELDRSLSDEERDCVFSAADVVWVGYRAHRYMSGVLVLAGAAGVPVVGAREGEIGRMIERHQVGIAVQVDSAVALAAALRAMLDPGVRARFGANARSAFAGHTVEAFGAGVTEALGLAAMRRQQVARNSWQP